MLGKLNGNPKIVFVYKMTFGKTSAQSNMHVISIVPVRISVERNWWRKDRDGLNYWTLYHNPFLKGSFVGGKKGNKIIKKRKHVTVMRDDDTSF